MCVEWIVRNVQREPVITQEPLLRIREVGIGATPGTVMREQQVAARPVGLFYCAQREIHRGSDPANVLPAGDLETGVRAVGLDVEELVKESHYRITLHHPVLPFTASSDFSNVGDRSEAHARSQLHNSFLLRIAGTPPRTASRRFSRS
jgi:hypothetical protein